MAPPPKLKQPQQQQPAWPWGGPRAVRERLVDKTQLGGKKTRKKGDPKNPALASMALLDFIGPADSSEALRLPLPPAPVGHDADLESFTDRAFLGEVMERVGSQGSLHAGLNALRAAGERVERLKSMLACEDAMLRLLDEVESDMKEVNRRRREEQREEGF